MTGALRTYMQYNIHRYEIWKLWIWTFWIFKFCFWKSCKCFRPGRQKPEDEQPKIRSSTPPQHSNCVWYSVPLTLHTTQTVSGLSPHSKHRFGLMVHQSAAHDQQTLVFVVRNFVFVLQYVFFTSLWFQKQFSERISANLVHIANFHIDVRS